MFGGWWASSKEAEATTKADKNSEEDQSESIADSKSNQKDATETAKDIAKNFGSFLYNVANVAGQTAVKVKDTVKETVEGKALIADFNKEQEKFLNEKHSRRKETGVPPWVGYHEEETMKSQILALSSNERNFLCDPPAGVQFHYDYDTMFPVALATLEEDPELKKMRFNLVPKKVKEGTFWRNYFYRVSLIKQSSQLTTLAATSGNGSETSEDQKRNSESNKTTRGSSQIKPRDIGGKKVGESATEDLGDLSSSPTHEEFISDAYGGAQELSKEDLEQIGVERLTEQTDDKFTVATALSPSSTTQSDSNAKTLAEPANNQTAGGVPDWEKELQEELQGYDVVTEEGDDDGSWEKEIEDMLEAEES